MNKEYAVYSWDEFKELIDNTKIKLEIGDTIIVKNVQLLKDGKFDDVKFIYRGD